MTDWILWGALLFAQTSSNTWVSRARNSGSIAYHGIASVGSNGVWLFQLMFSINKLSGLNTFREIAPVAAFYIACTVAGAVSAHWFVMKHLERGSRRPGS
jgi:hypothetical protein